MSFPRGRIAELDASAAVQPNRENSLLTQEGRVVVISQRLHRAHTPARRHCSGDKGGPKGWRQSRKPLASAGCMAKQPARSKV